jgi:hypothetical protein
MRVREDGTVCGLENKECDTRPWEGLQKPPRMCIYVKSLWGCKSNQRNAGFICDFIAKSVGAERLMMIGNWALIVFFIVDAVCLQEATNTPWDGSIFSRIQMPMIFFSF